MQQKKQHHFYYLMVSIFIFIHIACTLTYSHMPNRLNDDWTESKKKSKRESYDIINIFTVCEKNTSLPLRCAAFLFRFFCVFIGCCAHTQAIISHGIFPSFEWDAQKPISLLIFFLFSRVLLRFFLRFVHFKSPVFIYRCAFFLSCFGIFSHYPQCKLLLLVFNYIMICNPEKIVLIYFERNILFVFGVFVCTRTGAAIAFPIPKKIDFILFTTFYGAKESEKERKSDPGLIINLCDNDTEINGNERFLTFLPALCKWWSWQLFQTIFFAAPCRMAWLLTKCCFAVLRPQT